MIYNLMTYLENELPGERIYINPKDIQFPDTNVPDRYIQLVEQGGLPQAWIKDTNKLIQIFTRDIDAPKARELSYNVFNLLDSRFGLILPAVTVDGVVYPAIQTSQISANAEPQFLKYDDEGRAIFSANYRIIFRRY